jgi:hypothetical protein
MIVWEFPCESRSLPGFYIIEKATPIGVAFFIIYRLDNVTCLNEVTKTSGMFLHERSEPEGSATGMWLIKLGHCQAFI